MRKVAWTDLIPSVAVSRKRRAAAGFLQRGGRFPSHNCRAQSWTLLPKVKRSKGPNCLRQMPFRSGSTGVTNLSTLPLRSGPDFFFRPDLNAWACLIAPTFWTGTPLSAWTFGVWQAQCRSLFCGGLNPDLETVCSADLGAQALPTQARVKPLLEYLKQQRTFGDLDCLGSVRHADSLLCFVPQM